jgi:hypothetical protein
MVFPDRRRGMQCWSRNPAEVGRRVEAAHRAAFGATVLDGRTYAEAGTLPVLRPA